MPITAQSLSCAGPAWTLARPRWCALPGGVGTGPVCVCVGARSTGTKTGREPGICSKNTSAIRRRGYKGPQPDMAPTALRVGGYPVPAPRQHCLIVRLVRQIGCSLRWRGVWLVRPLAGRPRPRLGCRRLPGRRRVPGPAAGSCAPRPASPARRARLFGVSSKSGPPRLLYAVTSHASVTPL